MKYYRPLRPVKAISFDLDDTLYNNGPVIERAQSGILEYIHKNFPELSELTQREWSLYRKLELKHYPELKHDVSLTRQQLLTRIMTIYGISEYKAIEYSKQALTEFIKLRSDLTVPPASIQLLKNLRQHYPMIAITNGNVDTTKIKLDDKFEFVLRPGDGFKSKPDSDLFIEAAKRLNIDVSDILHVGDNPKTDVYGAQNSGAQAVWFNPDKQNFDGGSLLPTVEISRLENLYKLLQLTITE